MPSLNVTSPGLPPTKEMIDSLLEFLDGRHIAVFTYSVGGQIKIVMHGVEQAQADQIMDEWRASRERVSA